MPRLPGRNLFLAANAGAPVEAPDEAPDEESMSSIPLEEDES
jgi:hypothetical protein